MRTPTIDGGIFANFVKDGRVKMITILDTKRGVYAPNVQTSSSRAASCPVLQLPHVHRSRRTCRPMSRRRWPTRSTRPSTRRGEGLPRDELYNPVENLGPEGTLKDINSQTVIWKEHYAKK